MPKSVHRSLLFQVVKIQAWHKGRGNGFVQERGALKLAFSLLPRVFA